MNRKYEDKYLELQKPTSPEVWKLNFEHQCLDKLVFTLKYNTQIKQGLKVNQIPFSTKSGRNNV